jgi:hypothetical protein
MADLEKKRVKTRSPDVSIPVGKLDDLHQRIRELETALREAREEVARRDEAIDMTCDGCTAIGDDGECYHPKWDHCPLYPFKANQAERDG